MDRTSLSNDQVSFVIERVIERLRNNDISSDVKTYEKYRALSGLFENMDEAIEAAQVAQKELVKLSLLKTVSPFTVMVSMILIITASTGLFCVDSVWRAELPEAYKTSSPTPAPTLSTATTCDPFGFPMRSVVSTMSSFVPLRAGSFCVDTTVPTTLPTCMLKLSSSFSSS